MGTLCESCETARFGDTLRAPDSPDNSGCIYCGNTAGYVLPEHTVMLDDEDGDECEISGYFVTDGTPRLCQSHLNAMRLETQTFWPDGTALLEAGD